MENWGTILHNNILGFVILLFIIGIINIWIAWRLCKEIIISKKHIEEADIKVQRSVEDQIELIKKESW